jgi:DNA polymerase-3 subunit chi
MINLNLTVPDFVGRFSRVMEVVVQAPAVRDPLRASYKFYQDRGYPLNNNRM